MSNVYILDEITVRQADRASFSAAYMKDYAPSARLRGMTLEGSWLTPPIELPGREITLFYLWSVAGPAEWWACGSARRVPTPISMCRSRATRKRPVGGAGSTTARSAASGTS